MQRTDQRDLLLRRAMFCIMLVLGILSCAISRDRVPVNGWWRSRGPVVPHDTFPADCTLCHAGGDWHTLREDFQFDHARETGYALEGAHSSAECLRCHNDRGPVAAFVARGCGGCHLDVHQGLAGKQCADCHEQADWRPRAEIANHQRTRFPLIGAHAATACFRCHPGAQLARFDHADTECLACHAGDLARANSPDHVAQGWTSSCDRCHIPTNRTGAGFNHSSFPLTGAHTSAACSACHPTGIFGGTPQDCFSCHADDYNGAANPNHVALGISTQCQDCHSTSTWQGALFNHTGIVDGCANCHQSDYNATTNPPHAAAGFPNSCEDCHDTVDWNNGHFLHSFPINSGDHDNLQCQQCHTTPNNFQLFSCTHCHEHRQKEMDDKHQDVQNYVWQSPACYNCHPDGLESAR